MGRSDTMKDDLPAYYLSSFSRQKQRKLWGLLVLGFVALVAVGTHLHVSSPNHPSKSAHVPLHAAESLAKCHYLKLKPGPPATFNERKKSDRFVEGTRPTYIRNATIWTGRVNGLEIVKGDLVLDKGLIKAVGHVPKALLEELELGDDFVFVDAAGAFVTPGIVDLHSHLGVDAAPALNGANDGNSRKDPILPWLRALDGINTHDDAYKLSISGGVTTALVLPGSANAIGGQGFVIKLRDTAERSPTSKLLEAPYSLNGSHIDYNVPPRWRQMKHACGENPSRVYHMTRMDNIWAFRQAYDKARQIKESQDEYCEKALNNQWVGLGEFPEDLQWEALVDVLRGRVKVQVHCYETVDLDDIVRLTNEFQFPIAAFHHAHETYLVPDLLKQAYDHVPAAAIFATNARYKRESWRGSEFAARILADNDIPVVMKSDHPVLNSRYLLYEAQQAHYYGLPHNLALAAVMSTPAQIMGMDHRIGFIKEGYDADLVVWDSHPLALGATPKQVFIDGIPQFDSPYVIEKPESFQHVPSTPNFDKEAEDALKYEGLPPLLPTKTKADTIVFVNVKDVFTRAKAGDNDVKIQKTFSASSSDEFGVVVVQDGQIVCTGSHASCVSLFVNKNPSDVEFVDLEGGAVSPGLTSYGSALGLEEIQGEMSTKDGYVFDPLLVKIPSIVGGDHSIIRAVDGLQYTTRDALLGYRAGVTTGITAPLHRAFFAGLSTAFSTGAAHKLEKGAVLKSIAGFHVAIHPFGTPSVSTQIAALRRMLLGPFAVPPASSSFVKQVTEGTLPLVVEVQSADTIATLILLKKEVEEQYSMPMKMTITWATEAHLVAKELGENNVGVILVPSRPFPEEWESRRVLPGPPLTQHSQITHLLAHNVSVGIGIQEAWSARNTRFDAAWAALEAGGDLAREDALALVSTNLEKLLGVEADTQTSDLVATRGGDLLNFESKVVGVISPTKKLVHLF